jgi:hypothetical protein
MLLMARNYRNIATEFVKLLGPIQRDTEYERTHTRMRDRATGVPREDGFARHASTVFDAGAIERRPQYSDYDID